MRDDAMALVKGEMRAGPLLRLYDRPAVDPAGISLARDDGEGFRISVYTLDDWAAMREHERPAAMIDDTGRYMIAVDDLRGRTMLNI
jgi:hypothetical protein